MANIETKRLRMVSWTEELACAALNYRERLAEIVGARVPDGFPNDPVRKYVLPATLKRLQHDASYGQWSGLIVHKDDEIIIGSMGFKAPPDEDGMVEVGYDIIEDYQGHGYATEMATAFIQWAFEEASVTRVTAECLVTNAASIRVLEKVGMRRIAGGHGQDGEKQGDGHDSERNGEQGSGHDSGQGVGQPTSAPELLFWEIYKD